MSTVRGVIFDKDGTLFDFARTWEAWAQALLQRLAGPEGDAAALGACIGFDTATARFAPDSLVIAGTPDEIAEALAAALPHMNRVQIVALLNEEAAQAPQAEAVPLVPFLSGLRAGGLMLGVATNDAETPARAHLQTAGALDLFDFVVGSDSGHGAKPGPGQLLAFCQTTGLEPGEVLMVGDSTHDLLAGRAAGMRGIGVLTGMATADTLAPHAVAVFDNIGHLPAWIAAQG
ncbi:HAD family hydrolase [uncultured Roseobacter sp.]|uniref:HAD family hydrolase n=1 Tax=uncultured Roseobacter sp. TaxID=114847 RepID=UPI002616AF38|nr:HAD family hydrolase [uncultured Roseobacter sp.]